MIPVVALSARNRDDLTGIKAGTTAATLTHDYLRHVLQAGALPIILPPLGESYVSVLDRLDGLVLTGGEDVDPSHYAQPPSPELGEVDPRRDALELSLVKEAVRRGMPVLGICRGAQVLNVALGGTLIQDLPSEKPGPIAHIQETAFQEASHGVVLEAGSRLAAIAGAEKLEVNSYHHQAISTVAPGLRAVAWASDGVVEAVEGQDDFLVGVQWHPECQRAEFSGRLFEAFGEACRAYARHRAARALH